MANTTRTDLQLDVQRWKDLLGRCVLKLNVSETEYLTVGEKTEGTLKVDSEKVVRTTPFE